jgi:predicted dehydrogenase/nucleoside-diphosphate-sugar epimerase
MSAVATDTHAQQVQATTTPRPSAPGRYAVALVGTGAIAEYHAAILQRMPHVELAGACDPDARRLDAFCDQWGIPHRAARLEELIETHKPDAVHVLVPPAAHFDVASQALQAGLHVLVEKPMALNRDDCERLLDLARENDLHVGVNHNAVHHPMFRRLIDDLRRGLVGRVEHVASINNLPLGQLAAGQHDHWMFQEPGNVLFEQGPHPLSQICELQGAVRRVETTCSGKMTLNTGKDFYSSWQHNFVCERGTAQMFLAFGGEFPDSRIVAIGQDGTIQVDLLNNRYAIDRSTRYMPPVDRFLRGFSAARQLAWSTIREMAGYGLSTLRLIGRSDPYYVSMRGSIEAFYRDLAGGRVESRSGRAGRDVIDGLEQATASPVVAAALLDGRRETASDHGTSSRWPSSSGTQARTIAPLAGDVLVIGGTGFIGKRLVAALAEQGCPVRLLVRRPSAVEHLRQCGRITVFRGDVRNAGDVDRAIDGAAAVVNLVAGAPGNWAGFESLFVEGTRNVAEACLRGNVPQLLHASSIVVYYLGRSGVVTEDTPLESRPEKRCDYSRAKLLSERLLWEYHANRSLPVTIFRPGLVIGPGSPASHLGVGEWPNPRHCISWGRNVRRGLPFVLVDDVVAAMTAALGRDDLSGRSFNLVGDVRPSAAEYVAALREETGRDIRLHRQSVCTWTAIEWGKWLIKAAARRPENSRMTYREVAYRTAAADIDCSAAKRELGWAPVADRETFLERGIRAALRGGTVE